MRPVIRQTVRLPASPDALFLTYLDRARHAQLTGAPATISAEPGAPFAAFGGSLTGTMLCVVAPRLIVQTWR